ncbi:SDR family oxidoreductase [Novosphingobium sp. SG751A]|uniref:SDR family NAD(P)-dependent oxidoreductase n=1 Tax=Novosphingobium sp. SG751A TaxID=2587000 RepID=UPI0015547E50
MTAPVSSRVAAITGAGSGVGRATALRFAREGYSVLLCDRVSCDGVLEEIGSSGGRAEAIMIDLADARCGEMIVGQASKLFGGLDVLIHNAAIGTSGSVETVPDVDFERVLDVNLMAGIRLAREAVPIMRERGGGAILFTAALAGHRYVPNAVAYAVSKAALIHLTRCMAIDHGRDGIRTNCVTPGPINTPMLHEASAVYGIPVEAMRAGMPTGHIPEPDEIAATYAFLASPAARSINGQAIGMDGGMSVGFFSPKP